MRISDWSSDVCSSDLRQSSGGTSRRQHRAWRRYRRRFSHSADRWLMLKRADGSSALAMVGCLPEPLDDLRVDLPRVGSVGPVELVPERVQVGAAFALDELDRHVRRSEEHTSELQSLMRISYAVF